MQSSGLNQESFDIAVALACSAFGQIADHDMPEWWPQCELLVPHIQSLTLRQDTSIKAKEALLLANHCRGQYLGGRARFLEAESLYENIITDRDQCFGLNDFSTLPVMQDLACVYQRRGRYVDAETLFKRILETRKAQLGPEHRDTLITIYHLAAVYIDQERNDDTETLLSHLIQFTGPCDA
jgi:tetratricopeptide (TPR) repeat protein